MRPLRAVLAHCWTGSPNAGWYPQARAGLQALGIPAFAPALPAPDAPVLGAWLDALDSAIGEPDAGLLLIGHSLGAVAALHWLARAPDTTRIAGALLVAPPITATGVAAVDAFLSPAPDLAQARRRAARVDALISHADSWLKPDPLALARRLLDELCARVRILPDGGHFAPSSGQDPLPELFDWAQGFARSTCRPTGVLSWT